MKKIIGACLIGVMALSLVGCSKSSGMKEYQSQEKLQQESIAQAGLPAIQQFREKKLLKDIYELRDQDGLVTYTYIVAENTGKLVLLGESIGYGIPAATQYNNPMKSSGVPQAEPNGLYSPQSAEGTWVMLKDPNGKTVKPVYVEARVIVSPYKLQ
jgi:hypothetical protein